MSSLLETTVDVFKMFSTQILDFLRPPYNFMCDI